MSWLFPLYLAGAAAVIAPILLHLRRQPPKQRVEFGSLMFLQETKREPSRQRRLEHWLILLLRCLLLLVLAGMFARPFWVVEAELGEGVRATVFLVDRSASMRRGDLWGQVEDQLLRRLRVLDGDERVGVAVFDGDLQWLRGLEAESGVGAVADVAAELRRVGVGWGRGDLGGALGGALDALGRVEGGYEKRVVVLTDGQEGNDVERLRERVWPEDVVLEWVPVRMGIERQGNMQLSLAGMVDAGEGSEVEPFLRVRVSQTRGGSEGAFQLRWVGAGGEVLGDEGTGLVQGSLQAGESRVLRVPLVEGGRVLRLSGDEADFDNEVHVLPLTAQRVSVGVLGEVAGEDEVVSPWYYLKRVLQPGAVLAPVVEAVSGEVWDEAAEGADLLVVGGTGRALSNAVLKGWGDWLRAGGLGVYVVGRDVERAQRELRALHAGGGWQVSGGPEGAGREYAMLSRLMVEQPLMAVFADVRLQDFSKVRFWNYRRLAFEGEDVEWLAGFDSGDPAWLRVRLGEGQLVVMASGWHPADSQLALSSKFVPLWFSWLKAAGFRYEASRLLQVGDELPFAGRGEVELMLPSGGREVVGRGERWKTREPGIYEWSEAGVSAGAAVQVPVAEGLTDEMDVERLKELGVRLLGEGDGLVAGLGVGGGAGLGAGMLEVEGRQRGWVWLLLVGLVLVVAEGWMLRWRAGVARELGG